MLKTLAATAALGALATMTGAAVAGPASAHGYSSAAVAESRETRAALAAARAGTAKYHDIDRAVADGFVPVSPCVAIPGVGGMGFHYLAPARLADGLNPAEPEVLLYAPDGEGDLRLVGVEYLSATPETFPGGVEFHEPGPTPFHTLHAWVWKNNADGIFADFNPAVDC